MDIGCATGAWVLEVAKEYPSSKVTGVDLSPIQPERVPDNAQFVVGDVFDLHIQSKYDLIQSR